MYSGRLRELKFDVELQERCQGIVNTLAYLWPKTPHVKTIENASGADWPRTTPWLFYNNDGSIAPVLHQYEREKWMLQAVDRAVEGYIQEHFPDLPGAPPSPAPARSRKHNHK